MRYLGHRCFTHDDPVRLRFLTPYRNLLKGDILHTAPLLTTIVIDTTRHDEDYVSLNIWTGIDTI